MRCTSRESRRFGLLSTGHQDADARKSGDSDLLQALGEAHAETACGLTVDEIWDDIRAATAQGHTLGVFTLRKVDGDWKLTDSR
jgi:hypothetical protein